jgi:hypothetical protein
LQALVYCLVSLHVGERETATTHYHAALVEHLVDTIARHVCLCHLLRTDVLPVILLRLLHHCHYVMVDSRPIL